MWMESKDASGRGSNETRDGGSTVLWGLSQSGPSASSVYRNRSYHFNEERIRIMGLDTVPMKDHAFAEAARKMLNASDNDQALANLARLLPTIGTAHGEEGTKVDPSELPE
jgi:hypothetical protein